MLLTWIVCYNTCCTFKFITIMSIDLMASREMRFKSIQSDSNRMRTKAINFAPFKIAYATIERGEEPMSIPLYYTNGYGCFVNIARSLSFQIHSNLCHVKRIRRSNGKFQIHKMLNMKCIKLIPSIKCVLMQCAHCTQSIQYFDLKYLWFVVTNVRQNVEMFAFEINNFQTTVVLVSFPS